MNTTLEALKAKINELDEMLHTGGWKVIQHRQSTLDEIREMVIAALQAEQNGQTAWLFNPWSGERRDARDVGSDTFGTLIAPPREALLKTPTSPAPQPMTDAGIRELAHQHLQGRGDGDIIGFARAVLAAQEVK